MFLPYIIFSVFLFSSTFIHQKMYKFLLVVSRVTDEFNHRVRMYRQIKRHNYATKRTEILTSSCAQYVQIDLNLLSIQKSGKHRENQIIRVNPLYLPIHNFKCVYLQFPHFALLSQLYYDYHAISSRDPFFVIRIDPINQIDNLYEFPTAFAIHMILLTHPKQK